MGEHSQGRILRGDSLLCSHPVFVPQQEAVTGRVSTVAQPDITLATKPCGVCALVRFAAVRASSSLLLCRLRLIRQLDRKVSQWKGYYGRGAMARSATTAVITDEVGCQLQSKVLDVLDGVVRAVVLVEDVGVGNCHGKQEIINIFIEFPALCAAAVVSTQLVTPIHSSHVGVILDDGFWGRDRDSGAIPLSSEYSASCLGLSGCGHYRDCFSVLPDTRTDLPLLYCLEVTPLEVCMNTDNIYSIMITILL